MLSDETLLHLSFLVVDPTFGELVKVLLKCIITPWIFTAWIIMLHLPIIIFHRIYAILNDTLKNMSYFFIRYTFYFFLPIFNVLLSLNKCISIMFDSKFVFQHVFVFVFIHIMRMISFIDKGFSPNNMRHFGIHL